MSNEQNSNVEQKRNVKNSDNQDGQQSKVNRRRMYSRKKVCRFCANKHLKLDYKEVETLRRFTTEGGKIIPRRISGNCSKHQRMLASEIKKARAIALLPYVKS